MCDMMNHTMNSFKIALDKTKQFTFHNEFIFSVMSFFSSVRVGFFSLFIIIIIELSILNSYKIGEQT